MKCFASNGGGAPQHGGAMYTQAVVALLCEPPTLGMEDTYNQVRENYERKISFNHLYIYGKC